MKVVNCEELEHRELVSGKSGERFSLSAVLSEALTFRGVFVHHEVLPPGRRASSPHSHSTSEEMIIVLSGRPTAHLGDGARQLRAGDCVAFPAGVEDLHWISNETTENVSFLVIKSAVFGDRIVYGAPSGANPARTLSASDRV